MKNIFKKVQFLTFLGMLLFPSLSVAWTPPGGWDDFTKAVLSGKYAAKFTLVNIPHRTAPTSPVNGDIWTTTGGLYARINGATVGPYAQTSALGSYLPLAGGSIGTTSAGGNLSILSTRGSELLTLPNPASGAWTVGAGWSAAGASLNKNADGTGTAVPTGITPLANRTYVLNITYTATVSSFGVTLGGSVSLDAPTSGTDYYLSTNATTALTITPTLTSARFNITAISLKLLDNATGILTVSGPTTFQSMMRGYVPYFDHNKIMQPSGLFYDLVTGYTGVGTAAPTTKLDVNGVIHVSNYVTTDASLRVNSTGGTQVLLNGSVYGGITNSGSTFSLGTGAGSTMTTLALTWNSSGNVGIGTTGPATKLQITGVGGTDATNGLSITGLGSSATRAIDLSGTGMGGTGKYWIYNGENDYWGNGSLRANGYIYSGSLQGDNIQGTGSGMLITANTGNQLARVELGINRGLLVGNGTKVGSFTAGTSNGTATITKTTHGLTLAVGELVHITGATTAADKGFYRIVSNTADTIVVDRALSGSDSNVALSVYKDVIGFSATDGANGQMFTSFSAQNKPLQIGGTTLQSTASTSLTSADVLMGGRLYLNQGFSRAQRTAVTTDAVAATDSVVFCNGTFSSTLHTPVGYPGIIHDIKNIGTGTITLGTAAGLIDGVATLTLSQYSSVTVISDGTNWYII